MKNNATYPTRLALRKLVLQTIGQKAKKRKQLIMDVINKCGYGKEELKDTGSDSLSTRLKSFTGIVINELLEEKALLMTDDFKIVSAESLPDKKEILEIFLKKYLTEDELKDNSPSGKKNIIKAVLGDLIRRKRSEIAKAIDVVAYLDEELRKNETVYNNIIKQKEKCYPQTPLGNKLKLINKRFNDCKKGALKKEIYRKEAHKTAMECISLAGGEFFERFCMSLIKACYGDKVIKDELTAGPGDKGIDGIIIVCDEIGFKEKILIQAKTKRKRGFIPLSEIREFLGVMTSENATKGLMISNSNYHKETEKFASKVKNLILIDQKKLIELMEKYQIGFVNEDGIIKIDEALFLEEQKAVC
ncbi:MAG: restriction endonuclease [Christensenellales bacterium]|jgi:restriction endonuclease Mrr|nr:restriction endonuclease [Clostridiales bacterium]